MMRSGEVYKAISLCVKKVISYGVKCLWEPIFHLKASVTSLELCVTS